jgi:DNA polymerase-3 subunit delta'
LAIESHPDLHIVQLPEGKNAIPVELLVGRREHRMSEGLCHDIAMKPTPGGRKIAIIEDADCLKREGANCLLKTLEEPPVRSMIILIGTSEQRQMPTIRSRAQVVRFHPLPVSAVNDLLLESIPELAPERAWAIAEMADGSLTRAKQLLDVEFEEFRANLMSLLARNDWTGVQLASFVLEYVEAAGKEAPPRRQRLRRVLDSVIDLYRHVERLSNGLRGPPDAAIAGFADSIVAARRWSPDAMAQLVGVTMDAQAAIDASANLGSLIACWSDEVSRAGRGETLLAV